MTSVSTDRRDGVNSSMAQKVPCLAATTANITLNGEQTIDSINLIAGDRCLCVHQNDLAENGIYVVDSGDWTRALDADGNNDLTFGTLVLVSAGTTNPGLWKLTTDTDIVVGETGLTFSKILAAP